MKTPMQKYLEAKELVKAAYDAEKVLEKLHNIATERMDKEMHALSLETQDVVELEEALHAEVLYGIRDHYLSEPNEEGTFVLWLQGDDGAGYATIEEWWFGAKKDVVDSTQMFGSLHSAANAIPEFTHCNETGDIFRVRPVKLKKVSRTIETVQHGWEVE